MTATYATTQPLRSTMDGLGGAAVLEFGTDWCGFCQSAQPLIAAALSSHGEITHVKIEDGKGRPLGRSFGVKLWPTLIFLKEGQEVARVVRPENETDLTAALSVILPG